MGESCGVRNTRMKSCDEEDRISELPDSIIQHILSLLPSTRDAVRTATLSKRWRTHLPVLIFQPLHHSGDAYFRFIENTLMLHYSQRIKKFHLRYDHECVKDPQFNAKVCFAVRKCMEELILICHHPRKSYLLPICLFDNASLVRLELVNCCFKLSWRVNWPSLKSLKMVFCSDSDIYNSSKVIENVVSGSPSLECFEFRGCMLDGVAIASYSLKVLSFVDAEVPETLKICCPNLVEFNVVVENLDAAPCTDKMTENILLGSPVLHSLKLVGCTGFDKLVIASKSLEVLHLEHVQVGMIEVSCPNLEKFDMLSWGQEENVKLANLPSSVCATLDVQGYGSGNVLNELLEPFKHVNELTMGRLFFRYVSEDYVIKSLPQLNNKCLTLDVGEFIVAIPGIAYALHSLRLETLVIRFTSNFNEMLDEDLQNLILFSLDYWNTYGSPSLSCLVSHLKTVEMIGLHETGDKCKFELEFIEFILKNAQVLKKMTVSLQKSRKDFVIEFSQKLLNFPRYSRCANVELLCSS